MKFVVSSFAVTMPTSTVFENKSVSPSNRRRGGDTFEWGARPVEPVNAH